MVDVTSWHRTLQEGSGADLQDGRCDSIVARFRDIDARVDQPALDTNVLAIHLGGPKRVIRRCGCHTLEVDVPENGITVMPAGEAFRWETFGLIDFAHLQLDQDIIRKIVVEEFDRDPDRIHLRPLVGMTDRRLERFFSAALSRTRDADLARLRSDALSIDLSVDVLKACTGYADGASRTQLSCGKLATWQSRRVVEYMRDNLADDIAMETLVALTGLGRARFFQAFKNTMGRTPFAHLLQLRLIHARALLVRTRLSMTEVAVEVGLSPTQFAVAFRRAHGTTPSAYRAVNAGLAT